MRIKTFIAGLLATGLIAGCGTLRSTSMNKSVKIIPEQVSEGYYAAFPLYYDDGPYTRGPRIPVESECYVYSFETENTVYEDPIHESYAYYVPKRQSDIVFRKEQHSGKGYHGGHLVILKKKNNHRYDYIAEEYFSGGRLVRDLADDAFARQFLKYCRKQDAKR